MKLSLLHATRGRPLAALEVRREWLDKALHKSEVEHLFAVDADDPESIAAVEPFPRVIVQPPKGCFRAYNLAATFSTGDLLIPIEDNLHPDLGWDDMCREAMRESIGEVATLSVCDGSNAHIEWCFTRKFFNERGLYHDDYFGLFGDTEVRIRARNAQIPTVLAPHILFRHDKMEDAIMARKQSKYLADELTFNRRQRDGWP